MNWLIVAALLQASTSGNQRSGPVLRGAASPVVNFAVDTLPIGPREMYLACQNVTRRDALLKAAKEIATIAGNTVDSSQEEASKVDSKLKKFCREAKLPHSRGVGRDPIWKKWAPGDISPLTVVLRFANSEQTRIDGGSDAFDANDAKVSPGRLVFDSTGLLTEGTRLWLGAVAHILKATSGTWAILHESEVAPEELSIEVRATRLRALHSFLIDSSVAYDNDTLRAAFASSGAKARSVKRHNLSSFFQKTSATEMPTLSSSKASTGAMSQTTDLTSAVLVGLTDFVIDQAKEEMALYTTRSVMRTLCFRPPAEKPRAQTKGNSTAEAASRQNTVTKSPVNDVDGASAGARSQRTTMKGKRVYGQVYLPGTCRLFAFDTDASNEYMPSTSALRASVISDLEALPITVIKNFPLPDSADVQRRLTAAEKAIALIEDVANGKDPISALVDLTSDAPSLQDAPPPAAVVALARLGRILQLEASGRQEIEEVTESNIPRDTVLLYTVRALAVDANSNAIKAWTGFSDTAVPGLRPPAIPGLTIDVERLTSLTRDVWDIASQLDTIRSRLSGLSDTTRSARLAGYAALIHFTGELIAAPLQNQLTDTEWHQTKKFLAPTLDVAERMSRSDYTGAMRALIAVADSIGRGVSTGVLGDLRVINFVADIAGAQTQSEVTKAFSRFADTMSGLRRKRSADIKGFWAINTYLGITAGYEWVKNPPKMDRPDGVIFGPMLPVGIELGRTALGRFKSPRIVLQLLNLGALASLRMSGNDSVDIAPAKISQVFAPGGWVGFGLKDTPLALLLGGEYGPQSRSILGGSRPRYNVLRLSGGLVVDVPLFVR